MSAKRILARPYALRASERRTSTQEFLADVDRRHEDPKFGRRSDDGITVEDRNSVGTPAEFRFMATFARSPNGPMGLGATAESAIEDLYLDKKAFEEVLREKRDAEIARYGWNSGEGA